MKKLTHKEALLVKLKAEGKTHAEAYAIAYSPSAATSTANSNTQKILNKSHVKQALEQAMIKHDLTLDRALKPFSDGLEATKKRAEVVDRDKRGAPIYEYVDEPDHSNRMSAGRTILGLMGASKQSPGTIIFQSNNYITEVENKKQTQTIDA